LWKGGRGAKKSSTFLPGPRLRCRFVAVDDIIGGMLVGPSRPVPMSEEHQRQCQSAVSAAILTLENVYSTALFHRVGRRIELTEAGRLFLDEARGVLARAAAAELALSELGGLKRGTLSVQASQTIASYQYRPELGFVEGGVDEPVLSSEQVGDDRLVLEGRVLQLRERRYRKSGVTRHSR
jgi:hypothetical protein